MNGPDFFDEASLIGAHDEGNAFDAVVPPIVQTSLFTFSSYDEMLQTYRAAKVRPTYTRRGTRQCVCSRKCWQGWRVRRTRSALPAACLQSRPPC